MASKLGFRSYEGEEPFIFVCYAHKDREKVHPYLDALYKEGYRIWSYEDSIPYESDYAKIILERIKHCSVFLMFITEHFVQSRYCEAELRAVDKVASISGSTLIIPVVLDEVFLPGRFQYYLEGIHIVSLPKHDKVAYFTQFVTTRGLLDTARVSVDLEYVRECKVIFLGDGAAGKSSLIDRMVNNHFEEHSLPTDGVKMTKWRTTLDGEPFGLRILDFGGQEIMHSMHRCFLTSHTVYVVVCESRDDAEIDGVAARWMETVKAFAPNCPVILVLNKADLNANVSVNESNLKERNPNLKNVLKTSAAVEPDALYGVKSLILAVQVEIPDCINRYEMSADMLGVKRELENMTEDYISAEKYSSICASHNITESEAQRALLDYFKDLGVSYYYESEDFDQTMESVQVLNPAWLTNGIYRLILRTPDNGFLTLQEIKDTLKTPHKGDQRDNTYTAEEVEYVLHVMRAFEISHYMGGGREMIPMKMGKTPPKQADRFPRKKALHLRWKGAYLPNNLIHRLMIRKFEELDKGCVWRTGGVFQKSDSQCKALAEMNDQALDVYVYGKRGVQKYMESFRDEIRTILQGLHLEPMEMLCHRFPNGKEGQIPYMAVIDAYEKGKEEIQFNNDDVIEYISPAVLLRDTYTDWKEDMKWFRTMKTGEPSSGEDGRQNGLVKYAGPVKDLTQALKNLADSMGPLGKVLKAFGKGICVVWKLIFH